MDQAALMCRSLERSGYRLTVPRRAVADLIAASAGPFTATSLLDDARVARQAIGRATVFRTIDALLDSRAIERLDLPSGEHAYVACEPAHHHHVVCSNCGTAVDVDDSGLRGVVRDVVRRTGFRIDEHRLELFGICPTCQAAAAPARRSA